MVPIFKCWQSIQKELQTLQGPNKTCLLAELGIDLQWNPTEEMATAHREVKLLVWGPTAGLEEEVGSDTIRLPDPLSLPSL